MSEPTTLPPAPERPPDGTRSRIRRRAEGYLAAFVPGTAPAGPAGFWANAWPFPAVVFAAFLISWGAARQAPPREVEEIAGLGAIPGRIMGLPGRGQIAAIGALFAGGGLLLYVAAAPFLRSMLRCAARFGVPEYLFIQWVAPFLSEF